jgi:ABC-2 type transport system permease protein
VRLLGIEIRRAFARRLTKMVIVIALAGIIAGGLTTYFKSSRTEVFVGPSASEQLQLRNEQIQECMRGSSVPGGGQPAPGLPVPPIGTAERQTFCEKAAGQLQFGGVEDKRFHLTAIMDLFKHLSVWFAIIAWLLAASYIGAEWRTGMMATLLTWEPRRIRVMIAKAIAAVVVTFVIVMVLQALLVGALYPAAAYRGTTAGTNEAFWRSFSYVGLRSGALAAMAAILGFAAGALGRNTAAGLGAGFVYLAVIEGGLLGGLIPSIRPWLIIGNAIVFVNNERNPDIRGRSPTQAALLLLGYAVGLWLIATLVTKKRDVT